MGNVVVGFHGFDYVLSCFHLPGYRGRGANMLVFGTMSTVLTRISCVAATLTSDMDLCIWAPVKNSPRGEWKNVTFVSSH